MTRENKELARFMSNKQNYLGVIAAALAGTTLCSVAVAQGVVYDNSLTPINFVQPTPTGQTEFGDRINMALPAGITGTTITDFKFEYQGDPALAANSGATMTLNIYDAGSNPAAKTAPANLLWSSTGQTISVQPGSHTVDVSGLSVNAPGTITWTVSFNNVPSANVANTGLLVYDPPTVGSSANDFWAKNASGTWSVWQIQNGAIPANFAAQVVAVPEPTTLTLGLVLGAGWLGFLGLKRRA